MGRVKPREAYSSCVHLGNNLQSTKCAGSLITHSHLPSKASSYPNFKDEEIKMPKVFNERTSGAGIKTQSS